MADVNAMLWAITEERKAKERAERRRKAHAMSKAMR